MVLVFDILGLNDDKLIDFPLKYRKKILSQKLNIGGENEDA
jgi:ATP-dependent DNA ligase